MATVQEITAIATDMANRTDTARDSIPESWYPMDKMPLVTKHMKTAEANALVAAFDVPWETAMAYGQSDPDRPTLGQNWFNKGNGWVEAGARRSPLTGTVELRGVIYCTTSTFLTVMTLPSVLRPAENELFSVNMWSAATGVLPVLINIYTTGVVAIWSTGLYNSAAPTQYEYLTLSGIRYEAAL